MHPLLEKISGGLEKKICSAEIEFRGEDVLNISVVNFEVKRKNIRLGDSFINGKSTELLKEAVKKDTALVLNLTGRGIITKRVEKTEDFRFSFKQVIPNANEEDFYYQVYDSPDHLLVTIIRRSALDRILEELCASGIKIAKLFLGPVTTGILGTILKKETIYTPLSTVKVSEPGIIDQVIPEINENCTEIIDGKKIEGGFLVSVAAGYSYLGQIQLTEIDSSLLAGHSEELRYRQLLNKIGFGTLAVLLLCLLFNQYIFSHYQERYLLLEQILQQTANERYELIGIKTEIEDKQRLIESTGLFQAKILSFYADRIASTVPEKIILTAFWINPLPSKKLTEGEQADFIPGDIHIEGKVSETNILNSWIALLKTFEWAKEVKIDNYKLSANDDLASFTVIMKAG